VPTIEKTILLEGQKVDDLWGLYLDLRKADFQVKNVAADGRGTYVYLELTEEKDPSSIVESWVGKPAPVPSALLRNVRAKELEKVEAEEGARIQRRLEAQRLREEMRAKAEAEGFSVPPTEDSQPVEEVGPDKIGFLKRIFRKFF
jgi:hypothetical protein